MGSSDLQNDGLFLMKKLKFITIVQIFVTALGSALAVASDFQVIVNSHNPLTSIERKALGDIFLKKVRLWSSGEKMLPVDLAADSGVRKNFSDKILKRSVSAVRSYWQQMIFSGRGVQPPELKSDQEVVKYVLQYPGAIGYVSINASTTNVKVLQVKE